MNGFSSMDSYHLFVLLLTCHLLSDYYFQSQNGWTKKDKNIRVPCDISYFTCRATFICFNYYNTKFVVEDFHCFL